MSGGNSGSREPNPQAVSALSGFDPGRLTEGARRALMRHTRRDGGLFGSVLDDADAEDLWFASMLSVAMGGPRLVTRTCSVSGISGSPIYTYYLTPAGAGAHDALAHQQEQSA